VTDIVHVYNSQRVCLRVSVQCAVCVSVSVMFQFSTVYGLLECSSTVFVFVNLAVLFHDVIDTMPGHRRSPPEMYSEYG